MQMSTDELRQGTLKLPPVLFASSGALRSFQRRCDEVTRLLLSQVESSLGISLADRHTVEEPSESGLKLIYEPSLDRVTDVGENKHCDSGTWTMLFYDAMGVQVYLGPDKEGEKLDEWRFLPPPPKGCVLVHPGSSLERLTGRKVKSPLHRVTQPSNGAEERYFLCYFLRPEHKLAEEWAAKA